jgi:hypothetical protein
MYTEELFIHDGSKRKGAEGVHASIVNSFRVLVFALARHTLGDSSGGMDIVDLHSSLKVK